MFEQINMTLMNVQEQKDLRNIQMGSPQGSKKNHICSVSF